MFQYVWANAFLIGLVSALSMPLGALTALVWSPKNRALAFLIAFGSGALLAAVIIDLVGNAKEKGHILELIIGSLLGNLFFTFVNFIVNKSGGFLRKSSTTLSYLSQQERRNFLERFSGLKRVEIFQDLSQSLQEKIANILLSASYSKGTILYRQGEPSESLYIIKKGQVDLLDTQADFRPFMTLSANNIFGQFAFFTGSLHQTLAIISEDCQLEILPRHDFEELLETSSELLAFTEKTLQQEAIKDYLQNRQGLSISAVREWEHLALETLRQDRKILAAVKLERKKTDFLHLARQIERFPIFSYLPQEDLEEISDRLVYHQYSSGYVFFQPRDFGDILYIIHWGEVQIIYPTQLQKSSLILTGGEPFGELSFVTGTAHTVTAIAKTEVAVWTLRKQDFEEILKQSPHLENAVKEFLKHSDLQDYLHKRHDFESAKVTQWIEDALKSMNAEKILPAANIISSRIKEHKNAPMSIWIGLLMDAIPEALTIGAHLAIAPISPTLIAGLFIANYPEALSSSDGMKKQGFSVTKILLMWTSIMLITGFLSALGSIIFATAPKSVISLLEAVAAGAILTVISETMLPEAYAKGGSIVGLSTLLGFLVIIVIAE
jgi:CRP-like cAMP-binding protein